MIKIVFENTHCIILNGDLAKSCFFSFSSPCPSAGSSRAVRGRKFAGWWLPVRLRPCPRGWWWVMAPGTMCCFFLLTAWKAKSHQSRATPWINEAMPRRPLLVLGFRPERAKALWSIRKHIPLVIFDLVVLQEIQILLSKWRFCMMCLLILHVC